MYFGLPYVVFVLAWERKTNPPAFLPEIVITILNGLVIELYQMERKEFILFTFCRGGCDCLS